MPVIRVDWNKQDQQNAMLVPGVFDNLPRSDASVVLHAARMLPGNGPARIYVECAVALAEVTHIDAITALIETLPPGEEAPHKQGYARAHIASSRLNFRSGDPIIVLHPFSVVEPIFRAYRQQRDFPLTGPQVPSTPVEVVTPSDFILRVEGSDPVQYILATIHDEVMLTPDRNKAQRFSQWDAERFLTRRSLWKNLGGSYRMEPA